MIHRIFIDAEDPVGPDEVKEELLEVTRKGDSIVLRYKDAITPCVIVEFDDLIDAFNALRV